MKCNFCQKIFSDEFSFCPWCGQTSKNLLTLEDLSECTLEQIFELWSNEHYPLISEQGIEGYKTAWNRLSALKAYRFRDLKTMHYQTIITEITNAGLSRASAEKVQHLVSQLCKFAIKNDVIDRNYGLYLTLPKAQKSNRERFTDEELSVLWKNSAHNHTVQIILILAYTGFRVNELFTLKKENVHLDEDIPYFIGGSKTEAGKNRTIVISRDILSFVEYAYITSNEYLFENREGKPLDYNNWRKREYYPTLESLGLPKRTIHCLRHTFASMMIKAGADQKSIAQMMGHTKISTTADIYAHADLEQLSTAIQKLPERS